MFAAQRADQPTSLYLLLTPRANWSFGGDGANALHLLSAKYAAMILCIQISIYEKRTYCERLYAYMFDLPKLMLLLAPELGWLGTSTLHKTIIWFFGVFEILCKLKKSNEKHCI